MEEIKITTEKFTITRLEDGIIKVEVKRNVELKEKDLAELDSIYKEVLTADRVPFLIVFGENAMAQPDARLKFADKNRAKIKSREAFVLVSLAHRLMAQFHITFHKPDHPTRIFASEKEALKWLRSK